MVWTDLGNPRPRDSVCAYEVRRWPEGAFVAFQDEEPPVSSSQPLHTLIKRRRTSYAFDPVSLTRLGTLFDLTCRVAEVYPSSLGFPLSLRPVPSAGGIHPIHVVVHRPNSAVFERYDPWNHGLRELRSVVDPGAVRTHVNVAVETSEAVVMMLVAEPGMTSAKYEHAESLVWRDAGVLLGSLALVCEALDLNFVPLGMTGEPWAEAFADAPGLCGVGMAIVAGRPLLAGTATAAG